MSENSTQANVEPSTPHVSEADRREERARDKAKDTISGCWIGGLALLVLGAWIAGASLPSFGPSLYGPSAQSGSTGGFFFGLLLAGVGQLVLLVGIIATGVRLGVATAPRSR